jgi:hypothetical protein
MGPRAAGGAGAPSSRTPPHPAHNEVPRNQSEALLTTEPPTRLRSIRPAPTSPSRPQLPATQGAHSVYRRITTAIMAALTGTTADLHCSAIGSVALPGRPAWGTFGAHEKCALRQPASCDRNDTKL